MLFLAVQLVDVVRIFLWPNADVLNMALMCSAFCQHLHHRQRVKSQDAKEQPEGKKY